MRKRRSFDDITFYLPYLHTEASVLDYLPNQSLLILDNPESLQNHLLDLNVQAQEMKARFEQEDVRVPAKTEVSIF